MRELILGGARSGKSALAEQAALSCGLQVTYIATATAGDEEMAARIRYHQASRPNSWQLLEVPHGLAAALANQAAPDRCLLVDCLTLWLSNILPGDSADQEGERRFAQETSALLDILPLLPGRIILVSNEVGSGVVPMGAVTRRFVDEAGRLHQRLAVLCNRVTWVVAGLPQVLKDSDD